MKEEYIDLKVNKNTQAKRFELTIDKHTAFIDYRKDGNSIELVHTESPEALAGKGVATALIEKSLAYIEEHNYEVIPSCPLIFKFIQRNPEWKRIVSKAFPAYDKL